MPAWDENNGNRKWAQQVENLWYRLLEWFKYRNPRKG